MRSVELKPGRLLSILLRALVLFITGRWCDKVPCGQLTGDRPGNPGEAMESRKQSDQRSCSQKKVGKQSMGRRSWGRDGGRGGLGVGVGSRSGESSLMTQMVP